MDEDLLVRSPAAQYASAVFHRDYNDFDIYIEDTAEGYRKIFSNLLKRVLALDNIALDRVYPLAGRLNVITAAKTALRQQGEGQRRRAVFIVDGDLYLLTGEANGMLENVITLPRYCIENFLLDFDSWVELMDEECPEKSREKIESEADLLSWLEQSLPPLRDLFLIFAVNHYLGTGIQTVSMGYSCVCKNHRGEIDVEKVNNIVSEIREKLVGIKGRDEVERAFSLLFEKIDEDLCFLKTYVSAKDFSLPLLICRFRSITKSRASNINIKLRLSKTVDIAPLQGLVNKIKDVAGWPHEGVIGY